jgi:hypothetical protein
MVILRLEEGYVEDYVDEDTGEITQLPVEDKIIGRAILWTDSKDRKVMDRIYVNDHSDVEFFKEFANKNNFLYKKEQDFNEDTPFMYKKAELSREDSIIKVELYKNVDYDSYPYMDTLKYYTISTGIITNEETRHSDYSLEDTEGNIGICSFCSGSGDVICPECSGNGTVTCIDCSGNGSQDCNFCNGYEHVTCPECDGDDPDCSFCNGDVLECPECNGSGKEDCEKCEGSGDIKCGFCNGDERVPCPDC